MDHIKQTTFDWWTVVLSGPIVAHDADTGCICTMRTDNGVHRVTLYREEPPGTWHYEGAQRLTMKDVVLAMRTGVAMIAAHIAEAA